MIDGNTRVLAVLGDLQETAGLVGLFNRSFNALGKPMVCAPFAPTPEALKAAVEGVRALSFVGAWLNPPLVAELSWLDGASPVGTLLGAARLVTVQEGRLMGDVPDGRSLARLLKEELLYPVRGKRVTLLGCGLAGKAIALALADEGVAGFELYDRRYEQAEWLAELLRTRHPELELLARGVYPSDIRHLKLEPDVLINAASQDADDLWTELSFESLPPTAVVVDINQQEPRWILQACASRGIRTRGGLSLLRFQVAEVLSQVLGEEVPAKVVDTRAGAWLTRSKILAPELC
jgi:shikimate dehydrogenase